MVSDITTAVAIGEDNKVAVTFGEIPFDRFWEFIAYLGSTEGQLALFYAILAGVLP